jgi:hypothetical protein
VQNILSTIRLKNQEQKVNIYSWKLIILSIASINTGGICFLPVQTFHEKQPLLFFSLCQYFTQSHAITQNHLGDGTWVFVTNIIADYIATDYPSYGYVLTLKRIQ